jgi:hypothetical protein
VLRLQAGDGNIGRSIPTWSVVGVGLMDYHFWRIVVGLGVPGLALGVFFALYNKLPITLAPVPPEWTGPIAILFLVLTAAVVVFAIATHRPAVNAPNRENKPKLPKGYRRFHVLIVGPDGHASSIAQADFPQSTPWHQATNAFAVNFDFPQEPRYRLLDIEQGVWLPEPKTLAAIKKGLDTIGVVHEIAAEKCRCRSNDVARSGSAAKII